MDQKNDTGAAKNDPNLSSTFPYADWMTKLFDTNNGDENDKNSSPISINQLVIPGSHDAGAYNLDIDCGIACDRPDLSENFWIKCTKNFSYPLIYHYSITQTKTIYEQLLSGVRYIDLRIGLKVGSETKTEYHIVHNFYGENLLKIFEQIKKFLMEYPKEILIIDIQHVWGLHNNSDNANDNNNGNLNDDEGQKADGNDEEKLHQLIHSSLGDFCFPFVEAATETKISPQKNEEENNSNGNEKLIPTIQEFWNRKKQIFICWRATKLPTEKDSKNNVPPKYDCCFWPSNYLISPWANTTQVDILENFLPNVLEKEKKPNSLFVSQSVLTPNFNYVLFHCFSSLQLMAIQAHRMLWKLLNEEKLNDANIIMFDFIDTYHDLFDNDGNQIDIIKWIIEFNQKKFKKQLDQQSTSN